MEQEIKKRQKITQTTNRNKQNNTYTNETKNKRQTICGNIIPNHQANSRNSKNQKNTHPTTGGNQEAGRNTNPTTGGKQKTRRNKKIKDTKNK